MIRSNFPKNANRDEDRNQRLDSVISAPDELHAFALFLDDVLSVVQSFSARNVLMAAYALFAEQNPWPWGSVEANVAAGVVCDALEAESDERCSEIRSMLMFATVPVERRKPLSIEISDARHRS